MFMLLIIFASLYTIFFFSKTTINIDLIFVFVLFFRKSGILFIVKDIVYAYLFIKIILVEFFINFELFSLLLTHLIYLFVLKPLFLIKSRYTLIKLYYVEENYFNGEI